MNSIPTENHGHFPVMLSETINNLNILETGFYIDGTVGLGGHSYKILQNFRSDDLVENLTIANDIHLLILQ